MRSIQLKLEFFNFYFFIFCIHKSRTLNIFGPFYTILWNWMVVFWVKVWISLIFWLIRWVVSELFHPALVLARLQFWIWHLIFRVYFCLWTGTYVKPRLQRTLFLVCIWMWTKGITHQWYYNHCVCTMVQCGIRFWKLYWYWFSIDAKS